MDQIAAGHSILVGAAVYEGFLDRVEAYSGTGGGHEVLM